MNTKERLSTLWLLVMLNMILADVLSLFVALKDSSVLGIPDNVKPLMAVSAVIINLPILMIYFSKSLPYRKNKTANIIVAVVTMLFVVGGGSLLPHYLIIATIEVAILLSIIGTASKWREK